jgi:methylated-DNA-[protein]-cysteine S-methyltransferase
MKSYYKTIKSPVGKLILIASHKNLLAILWENEEINREGIGNPERDTGHPILCETEKQLNEYFAGMRKNFKLPLPDPFPGTEFQNKVWLALRDIPFGETISYEELACRIGSPKACRAVGAANGRNFIPIIIPCHRVIGKSGKLIGFGGGLNKKQHLLNLEHGVMRKNNHASPGKN